MWNRKDRIFSVWLLLVMGSCLLGNAAGGEENKPPHKTGIDISSHSGSVNWEEVQKQGFSFVILKASEGIDLKDPDFDAHWNALKQMDILRGAYHFYVTEDDPVQQAQFFLQSAPLEPGDLIPVVDIELIGHGTTGELYPKLKQFLNTLEEHYKVKPMIYTSPRFWNEHFRTHLPGYPLWIAEYGVEAPQIPEGWKTWHLWQWKENHPVAGIEKGADLSRINHEEVPLSELIIPLRYGSKQENHSDRN